jgi:amino acid adenylation domain-containing protein
MQRINRPVLNDFARTVESGREPKLPEILRAERGENLPLSFAQERVWFLAQVEGGSQTSHIPLGMRLRGRLERRALKRALDRIVARHEVLRTTFNAVAGEPRQQIGSAEERGFELRERDLRQAKDAAGELQREMAEEAWAEFDLQAGPLIRGRLIWMEEEEHWLLITVHHIVSDGWSMGVLFEELSVLYGAYVRGEEDPLPELGVQYGDYAVWQRKWMEREAFERQAEYWRKNLEEAPELLELPTDHVRPARQSYAGATAELVLDEKLTTALKELSLRHGVSLYMALLAGWAVLLGRLSGQQDVVIGMPVANRGRVEIEKLIGFFANTLAIRVDMSGGPTVEKMLKRVKEQVISAQQHQDIPVEQVVELVQLVRNLAHSPLFQVMFAWSDAPQGRVELRGLEAGSLRYLPHAVTEFDLVVALSESGGRIEGGVKYARALFEGKTVERYLRYYRRLLEGMVREKTECMDRFGLLEEKEWRQVVYGWNQTEGETGEKSVPELFEEEVKKRPEAVAVEWEGGAVSYGELNRAANRLGRYLRRSGVGVETRVGVCLERSVEMVVAMIGVLKAGGVYVPLDVEYPGERLVLMMEDAGIRTVITNPELRDRLSITATQFECLEGIQFVCFDVDQALMAQQNEENATWEMDGRQLVYVMYTSGSTGRPKAIEVEHRAIQRLVCNAQYVELNPDDVMLQMAPITFDASTFEIWGALLNGLKLIVAPAGTLSLEQIGTTIENGGVTVMWLTAGLFHAMVQQCGESLARVRQLLAGGDVLSRRHVEQYLKSGSGNWLINGYGPTEATTFTCCHRMRNFEPDWKSVPIGKPIGNTQVYVVDGEMEAVGIGLPGEICVGGKGVARGYGNNAELTAERFVPNPFSVGGGERMYRTGDVGRWREGGNVEFEGRRDEQVKVRGYRIELGEVELALRELGGVKEAVAVVWEKGSGDKQLVGYVVKEEGVELRGAEVREEVRKKLPEYMVPVVVVVEEFPLTRNGKLNRKALPRPEADTCGTRSYEPPKGEIEQKIADIWAQMLKVGRVGRHDNFFELGGHSLLAITVVEHLRREGIATDVRALFGMATVAELAAASGSHSEEVEVPPNLIAEGCETINTDRVVLARLTQEEIDCIVDGVPGGARNVQDIYPLGPLQGGILFHHLMGGQGDPYLLVGLASFDNRPRLERYLEAVQEVINRHDILRTSMAWEGLREPAQVVWREAKLKVEEVELRKDPGYPFDAAEELYRRYDPRQFRIDLKQAPLLRVYVAYDPIRDRWLMMLLMHHLIGDHTTVEVIQEEVRAFLLGQAGQLSAPLPFRNLVAEARLGVSDEEHENFFRKMLGDVQEPTAPFGLVEVQGDGSGIDEARLELDRRLVGRMRAQAQRLGVTVASICHLAWAQLVAKMSGREDVVFGTVLFGRMQGGADAGRALGLFINTLPIRLQLGGEGVEASVQHTHRVLAELLRHEHASLMLAQSCSGVTAPTPLFSALLNYTHTTHAPQVLPEKGLLELRATEGMEWLRSQERSNYPLTLTVDDLGERFALSAQTVDSVNPLRICKYMQTALTSLVEGLEEEPARAVWRVEVLSSAERDQLLYQRNDTWKNFFNEKCVHEVFEEHVERMPEAIAVVDGETMLSYGELNRRANRLAHYLRRLGVGPETPVGICSRGLEIAVGMTAVLKAGGACVPLNAMYPSKWLSSVLQDSGARVFLPSTHLRQQFVGAAPRLQVVDLGNSDAWASEQDGNLEHWSGVSSEHLAYVVYPSGSSTEPRGMMVTHDGILRLVQDQEYMVCEDVIGQRLNASFDRAIFEIWGALLHGGRFVWVEEDKLLSTARQEVVRNKPMSMVEEGVKIPIGWPMANTRTYVLDVRGEPAAKDVMGELYISGAGLGRGYLNRPDITGEQFIPNPYGGESWGRMYRTGDMGKWRENGVLESVAPADEQIEIQGRRIKPREIEAWMKQYGGVEDAVVIGREDVAGEKHLVAYYTVTKTMTGGDESWPPPVLPYWYPNSGTAIGLNEEERTEMEGVEGEDLRGYLLERLPEYMVPRAYVLLEQIPLTAEGKVDIKALLAPKEGAIGIRRYEMPEGEIETAVAGIWADVLRVERIGRHDDFFELGGRSLRAVQVAARVRQVLDIDLTIRDIFEHPTLSSLAEQIINLKLSTFRSDDLVQLLKEVKSQPGNVSTNAQLGKS